MRRTILLSFGGFVFGEIVFGAIALSAMSRAHRYERQMSHCETLTLSRKVDASFLEGLAKIAVASTNVTDAGLALAHITHRPENEQAKDRHMSSVYNPDKSESIDLYSYEAFECIRAHLEREVIAHLRKLTGQDLGDDPEPWVNKYKPR